MNPQHSRFGVFTLILQNASAFAQIQIIARSLQIVQRIEQQLEMFAIALQVQLVGIDSQQRGVLIKVEKLAVSLVYPPQIAFGEKIDDAVAAFLQAFAVAVHGGLQVDHQIGGGILRQDFLFQIGEELLFVFIQHDRRENPVFSNRKSATTMPPCAYSFLMMSTLSARRIRKKSSVAKP